MSAPTRSSAVIAAGAVVLRKHQRHGRQVLLVHRPKYDDWSFPKGKRDPGEHVTTTATREVFEETGVEIRLGRALRRQTYAMSGGREKTVHYWIGRVLGDDDVSSYAPNSEIDDVRWVGTDEAMGMLSYLDDVAQLEGALKEPRRTRTLVIVRHARALKRDGWDKDDTDRPLTPDGRRQARALVPVLRSFGIARVISSPSVRCLQTLSPYAEAQAKDLERWPALSEESTTNRDEVAQTLLSFKEPTVVGTHRPVLPGLLMALGIEEEPLAPGEFVTVHHRKGQVINVERHLIG